MLRKFLLLLTTAAILATTVFTSLQLIPLFKSLDFGDPADHFTMAEKRYTVTASAEEGGKIEGVATDYAKGDLATLVAVADEGYIFNGWYSNNGSCKATSTSYSFSVEKNTALTAKFVPAPEEMKGEFEAKTEYTACTEDFEFPVFFAGADAGALSDALKVVDADLLGTDYEDLGTVLVEVVSTKQSGEYIVRPKGGAKYNRGTTYTASTLASDISFAGGANTLSFTIEGDKNSTANYAADLVELAKSAVTDMGDYIVTDNPQIQAGTIVWLYEEEGELVGSKFLKIASVGGGKAYYETPDLEDVYAELDIFSREKLDLGSLGGLSKTLKDDMRQALLENDAFIYSVAYAQEALYNAAARSGYGITLLSEENLLDNVVFDISAFAFGDEIQISVIANCHTPILDKSGKEIAVFVLTFELEERVTVTPNVSIKLRKIDNSTSVKSYNIGVTTTVTEEAEVRFSFAYDGNDTLFALEESFGEEVKKAATANGPVFEKVKDTLEKASAQTKLEKEINVFTTEDAVVIENFAMNFDINLRINLDIAASLTYHSTTTQKYEIGIRSSGNGPQYFENKSTSAYCSDLVLSGQASVNFGINANYAFELLGFEELVNARFAAVTDSYVKASGCANINAGHAAANLEIGTVQKFDYAYNMFDYSLDTTENEAKEAPIFKFGYGDAYLGFANSANIEKGKGITLIEEETDISDIAYLALSALDLATLERYEVALDKDSSDYIIQVRFEAGSNLNYANGKIRVKNNAPAFFEETVTITIKSKSSKWSSYRDGAVYVNVPTITVPVVFGDQDAYYEATDTNIQKQFRRIYRSYNKANADLLREGFEEMIEGFVTIPESKKALYHDFTAAYLGNLFDLIEAYKPQEDNKRTMENKFVYEEATIFDDAVLLIYDIMDGKELESEIEAERGRIYNLLAKAEGTTALYNTLIEVQDNEELTKQLSTIGPKTRERIETEINSYETKRNEEGTVTEKTENLILAARKLFGFAEADVPTEE